MRQEPSQYRVGRSFFSKKRRYVAAAELYSYYQNNMPTGVISQESAVLCGPACQLVNFNILKG